MTQILDEDFWSNRYQTQDTGWDVGSITAPLKAYIDQLTDKNLKILIPGAGNSYEAEYLHKQGFANVTVIDIAMEPLNNLQKRCATFPVSHLLHQDFFALESQYDLILEQTFFCALDPLLRERYVKKMNALLKPGGKLVGVLLCNVFLDGNGPPFGASDEQYREYFSGDFTIKYFAECYNSIKPRQGVEWFMALVK